MRPLPGPLAARLYLSLLIAAAALYAGFVGDAGDPPGGSLATHISWGLGIVWIALFTEALVRLRERSMILLAGAPFALFWLMSAVALLTS
jgi:hypothetical protein